jgi:hypothetical protein
MFEEHEVKAPKNKAKELYLEEVKLLNNRGLEIIYIHKQIEKG